MVQSWFVRPRVSGAREPFGDIDDGMRLQLLCFSQKMGPRRGPAWKLL
jgi:hypothetical protein